MPLLVVRANIHLLNIILVIFFQWNEYNKIKFIILSKPAILLQSKDQNVHSQFDVVLISCTSNMGLPVNRCEKNLATKRRKPVTVLNLKTFFPKFILIYYRKCLIPSTGSLLTYTWLIFLIVISEI